jgi:hypothetical protein
MELPIMESILVPFPAWRARPSTPLVTGGERLLNVVNIPHYVVIKPQKVEETAQEAGK